jgi:hypothetical protein
MTDWTKRNSYGFPSVLAIGRPDAALDCSSLVIDSVFNMRRMDSRSVALDHAAKGLVR